MLLGSDKALKANFKICVSGVLFRKVYFLHSVRELRVSVVKEILLSSLWTVLFKDITLQVCVDSSYR